MSLLPRVLEINASFPLPEALKYSVTVEAQQIVAGYRQEADPDPELTYAIIRLLRALKRYPEALELMVDRRPVIAGKAREIDFYEIELHFLCGEREAGEELLKKFNAAGYQFRPSWKRSLDRLTHKSELDEVQHEFDAVEQAFADLTLDVDLAAHLPLLKTLLTADNQALEVLLFLRDRLARLKALPVAARPDLAAFDKYHRSRLVFACGFSWSGSGAVSCYLSQHKDVVLPFGMSEMAYFQGRWGRKGIFAFLAGETIAPEAMPKLLARFLVETVACLRRQHYSVLLQCLAGTAGRVEVLGELMDDFHRAMLSEAALGSMAERKRILARLLERLFSLKGGKYQLLNNVFLAPRIELADAMEDALFIAVERDARDQFLARRTESEHAGNRSIEQFGSAVLKPGRASFQAIRAAMTPEEAARKLMLVRFEDFLRDEEVRQQILRRIGLDPKGIVPDLKKFDAAASSRNIGIYAAGLTPQEIAYAENELGLYMR